MLARSALALVLWLPLAAGRSVAGEPAADLVDLFARACLGKASPVEAAETAAAAAGWTLDPAASGEDPMHGAPTRRRAWTAGTVGGVKASLLAVSIAMPKAPACVTEYCFVTVEPFDAGGVSSALQARFELGNPEETTRHDSRTATASEPAYVDHVAWLNPTRPAHRIGLERSKQRVQLVAYHDPYPFCGPQR